MVHQFVIPVKPHVQKYLLFHLGENYRLSSLDAFGIYLKGLLERPQTNNFLNGFLGRYTGSFGCVVACSKLMEKRLRDLQSKSIIDFNNFVEAIVKTEFHGFVDNRKLVGLSQYGAIQAFREKYNFQDEDISFDTLKKSYQRFVEDRPVRPLEAISTSVCPPRRSRLAAA